MIRLAEPAPPLEARQRFALDLLLDLSRLLRTDEAAADAVTLRVAAPAHAVTIAQLATLSNPGAFEVGEGSVTIRRGVLDAVAAVAGAIDEQRAPVYDRHGRVPSSASAPVINAVEREPIVNRVASALRSAVVDAARGGRVVLVAPWPDGRRWAMAMTHDLDVVSGWPAFTALRTVELLRKAELRRAARVLTGALMAAAGDPVTSAAREVLEVERTHGIRSTWFIITETPTLASARAGDVTYTPETPRARRIIADAVAGGHEIALHGSFATYTTASKFTEQRERLAAIAGRDVNGVRQHFLRMQPGATHRAMTDAGLSYDSTCGFADRNGFRLGVADVAPLWYEQEQRVLPLKEMPFTWMDRALSKYRGEEDPDAWIADALAIAGRCREMEGVWCGIWHPNLATALGYPDAPRAFASLVESLMAMQPWTASVGEIVRWRTARRDVRAVGESGDTIRIRHALDVAITLEDQAQRPVAAVRT